MLALCNSLIKRYFSVCTKQHTCCNNVIHQYSQYLLQTEDSFLTLIFHEVWMGL